MPQNKRRIDLRVRLTPRPTLCGSIFAHRSGGELPPAIATDWRMWKNFISIPVCGPLLRPFVCYYETHTIAPIGGSMKGKENHMKKILALVLLLVLIVSLSACGKVEITMQEIYDANLTEALLKNHQSVYIQEEMDGEIWREVYLTKDYVYDYIIDENYEWVEFITDDAGYYYFNGDSLRYVSITPDGVSDFVSYRAERSSPRLVGEDSVSDIIESVSKKDGRITAASVMSQKGLEEAAEYGITSANVEYVLDAKNHEIISLVTDYAYEDGTAYHSVTKVTYDTDAPEMVKTMLGYDSQTENLRNVTIVTNPGTEKEVSRSIQAPKGLLIGLHYEEDEYVFEVYSDAACTEVYDPYADADSDLTIYVKWVE